MFIFLHEFLWVLCLVGLFGCCGWFATVSFASTTSYPLLLSPMIGLLFVVFGVSCFYSIFNLSASWSIILSIIICITLSLLTFFFTYRKKSPLSPSLQWRGRGDFLLNRYSNLFLFILFIFIFIGFLTYLNCFSTIHLGEPAFLFSDGADHLGYAQVADWLSAHSVSESPSRNLTSNMPHAVYQSWPSYMFYTDPRLGSFFTLAIISIIRNTSSMFAYDTTCAVVLVVSYLGLAAIFSRSRWSFILLCFGLLTNYWFSYAQSGFLGKILGYPSTLVVLGLFLVSKRPFSLAQLIMLSIITATAASMHFAMATAGFLLIGGSVFLLLSYLYSSGNRQSPLGASFNLDNLLILIFLVLITIIATGSLVTPSGLRHIPNPIGWTWSSIFPSLFDLGRFGINISPISSFMKLYMVIIYVLINVYFLIFALKKEDLASASLLASPFILLITLFIKQVYWIPQLMGIFYTWFLCGGTRLVDSTLSDNEFYSVLQNITTLVKRSVECRMPAPFIPLSLLILFILAIGMHVPCLMGDIERYAGKKINTSLLFSQHDMQQLANFAHNKKITVSINRGILILPLLVEIDKTYPDALQFSNSAWKAAINGYRDWENPHQVKTPYYIISTTKKAPSQCKVQLETKQYRTLRCAKEF